MRWHVGLLILSATGLAVGLTGCDSSQAIVLQGAGATFPAPIYKRWFLEYYQKNPNIRVSYQPIGSGAGVRQFLAGLIDFGASDAAMTDAEIKKAPDGVLMLPVTAGSISVAYNLPDCSTPIRLSRKTLSALFLGDITSWNDPAIAQDNPGVQLPDYPVRVVRRAESSGTTLAFTSHLAAASPKWKSEVGASKTVDKWKTGIGARGNSGVAATIKRTPGSIGYLESGYAKFANIQVAVLENKAGTFVAPTPESGQAALAASKLPANLRLFIPDPEGLDAYPIVTYTWILVKKQYADPTDAKSIKDLLNYCLTDGQAMVGELGYIPLPKSVTQQVQQAVQEIRP